jgi:hypothetical protein
MHTKILIRRPEGKSPLTRSRCRWEDNIRMKLSEIGWKVWTVFMWLKTGTSGRLL